MSNYDGSAFVKDLYVSMIFRMTLIYGVQKLLILCVDMNSIIYNMWGLKLYIVVNLETLHFSVILSDQKAVTNTKVRQFQCLYPFLYTIYK